MHNETRNTQNIMDNRCIITVSDQMAELLSEFQDNDFFKLTLTLIHKYMGSATENLAITTIMQNNEEIIV